MDFSIRVGNIDRGAARLREWGVALHGAPVSVDVGSGEWRYVYFVEPDGNYVALVEARY
jgi:predicted enzyme related to lactoylglutathione lyase